MSPDRQQIVDLASAADLRMRRQDQARFLTRAFVWSLVVPFALTIASLVGAVPAWALIALLSGWALAILGAAVWTWTRRYPLSRAAAEIDRRAALKNELTSALWFVQGVDEATASDHEGWVDLHVARAAKRASEVDAEALFPWRWPEEARTAGALAGVLIVLNGLMAIDLVPRSWTRAWLQAKLSSARPLNEAEKKSARDLKDLLQQVQQLDPTLMTPEDRRLAQQLASLVDDLDKEALTTEDAAERLAKIRQALEALADSDQAKTPLDGRSKSLTGKDLKQLEDALKRALEDAKLGKNLQAEKGESGDRSGEELRSEARAEMREAALRRLKDLEKSMGAQPRNSSGRQERGKSDQNQSGEPGENQEGAQSSAEAPGQGQMQPMNGDGQQAGLQARGSLGGASGGQTNLVGPKTALQVKLRREQLASPTARPGEKPDEKKEERFQETKQAQSKQQYQQVAPRKYAQPDAVEPNQVPWPYRALVKSYFQKVGPRGK